MRRWGFVVVPVILSVAVLLFVSSVSGMGMGEGNIDTEPAGGQEGQILIFWRRGIDRTQAAELRRKAGVMVVDRIPALKLELWQVPSKRLQVTLDLVRRSPLVAWAEPNGYLVRPQRPVSFRDTGNSDGPSWPDDPYYHLYSYRYLQPLGVEAAWRITQGDDRIVVAVVDTGVDCGHEDLIGACWQNPGEIPNNGLDDDDNGYVDDIWGWNFADNSNDVTDTIGHGTHVAGIIAARMNNGKGIAGMAPRVRIMPVRVFSGYVGTYYDLIRGIIYAVDNGARIINLSLGATTYSRGEEWAIRYALNRGVIVVAAAGNMGTNVRFYPAAHPGVIGVAALTEDGRPATFSNYGNMVDISAPGVNILSTTPGNLYGYLSGTSMATPHVAGVAALILSMNPSLTPTDVQDLLLRYAEDGVGGQRDDPPGWDPYHGWGRLRADRSLAHVPSEEGPSPEPQPAGYWQPWPDPCRPLVRNGDFESGWDGWEPHNGTLVTSPVFEGQRAARLEADLNATLSQRVHLPEDTLRAVLYMAVRVESLDRGLGTSPQFPFDDWLEVRLQGERKDVLLLRAGNSSDNVSDGLAWDEILVLLERRDLRALLGGEAELYLQTGADGDRAATVFYVDAVRFCVEEGISRAYLPALW